MAGFGRSPFGRGPYGRSDLGKDLLINLFPDEYFDSSIVLDTGETVKDNEKDPLLILLKGFAHSLNLRRAEVDDLPTLIDYESAPLEIVRMMGDMLGLGIDKNDPEFLQRSFLGNASQWLQIKSTKKGYEIRGLASGFNVSVDNFWRIDPVYSSFIPLYNQYYLKPKDADPSAVKILHTDSPPGSFPGTPTVEDSTYAKSAYIRVVFTVAEPRRALVDYNKLLDLVIDKIRDVVGIHHELQSLQFLIKIPIPVQPTFSFEFNEFCHVINASEFYRYDITPADEIACDNDAGTVTIAIGDDVFGSCGTTVTASFDGGLNETVYFNLYMTSLGVTIAEYSETIIDAIPTIDLVPGELYPWGVSLSLGVNQSSYESQVLGINEPITAVLDLEQKKVFVVNVTETASIEIDSNSSSSVNSLPIVSGNFGESLNGAAVISPAVGIQRVDGFAEININPTVTIDIKVADGIALTVDVNETSTIKSEENLLFEASGVISTVFSRIDGVADIFVNESVNIVVSTTDEVSYGLSVPGTVTGIFSEFSIASASESIASEINRIDSVVGIPANESITASIIPGVIFVYGVNVNEFASLEINETIRAVTAEIESASIDQINIESEIIVPVLHNFSFEIISQSSFEINGSILVGITPEETIPINVSLPMTVDFSRVDAFAEIPVGESVSIDVAVFDGISLPISVYGTVSDQSEEESKLASSEVASVSFTRIDGIAEIPVGESVSISVSVFDGISLPISVSHYSVIECFEESSLSVSEVVDSSFVRIDGIAEISVGESVVISIALLDGIEMQASVFGTVQVSSFEQSDISVVESAVASLDRVDGIAEIPVNETVAISISVFDGIGIPVSVTPAVSVSAYEEFLMQASDTSSVSFDRVDGFAEIPVGESVTISVSVFDGIAIPVPVVSTVTDEISEDVSFEAICSESVVPYVVESFVADIFVTESVVLDVSDAIVMNIPVNEFISMYTETGFRPIVNETISGSFEVEELAKSDSNASISASLSVGDEVEISVPVYSSISVEIAEEMSEVSQLISTVSWGLAEDEEIEIVITESVTVDIITSFVEYSVSETITASATSDEGIFINNVYTTTIDWSLFESESISISVSALIDVSMESAVVYGAVVSETIAVGVDEHTNPQVSAEGVVAYITEELTGSSVTNSQTVLGSIDEIIVIPVPTSIAVEGTSEASFVYGATANLSASGNFYEESEFGISESITIDASSAADELRYGISVVESISLDGKEDASVNVVCVNGISKVIEESIEVEIIELENISVVIDLATEYSVSVALSASMLSEESSTIASNELVLVNCAAEENFAVSVSDGEFVSVEIDFVTQYGVNVTGTSAFVSEENSDLSVIEVSSVSEQLEESISTVVPDNEFISVEIDFVTQYGVNVTGSSTFISEEQSDLLATDIESVSGQIEEEISTAVPDNEFITVGLEFVTQYGVNVYGNSTFVSQEQDELSVSDLINISAQSEEEVSTTVPDNEFITVNLEFVTQYGVTVLGAPAIEIEEVADVAIVETESLSVVLSENADISITEISTVTGSIEQFTEYGVVLVPTVTESFSEYASASLTPSVTISSEFTELAGSQVSEIMTASGQVHVVAGIGVAVTISEASSILEALEASVDESVSRSDFVEEEWTKAIFQTVGSGVIIHSLAYIGVDSFGSVSGIASGTQEIPEAVSGVIDVSSSVSALFAEYFTNSILKVISATPRVEEVLESTLYAFEVYDVTAADVITVDLHGTIEWQVTIGP